MGEPIDLLPGMMDIENLVTGERRVMSHEQFVKEQVDKRKELDRKLAVIRNSQSCVSDEGEVVQSITE